MKYTVLCADAGSGKSVALQQWLSSRSTGGASTTFRHIIVDARNDLFRGRDLADALMVSLASNNVQSYENLGLQLLIWVATFDGYIVIDHFDEFSSTNDPESAEFLRAMWALSKCRWIIATRSPARLPVSSWLAYGESDLAVDEFDLTFSFAELRLLDAELGGNLRDDALQALLADGKPIADLLPLLGLNGTEPSTTGKSL